MIGQNAPIDPVDQFTRTLAEMRARIAELERVVQRSVVRVEAAYVATANGTASATYADLSTPGPAVTLQTGTSVLVALSSLVNLDGAGNTGFMGVTVSGATTQAASDAKAMWYQEASTGNSETSSIHVLLTGLTAGSNTFTAKYRTNGGTATFTYRTISVQVL